MLSRQQGGVGLSRHAAEDCLPGAPPAADHFAGQSVTLLLVPDQLSTLQGIHDRGFLTMERGCCRAAVLLLLMMPHGELTPSGRLSIYWSFHEELPQGDPCCWTTIESSELPTH